MSYSLSSLYLESQWSSSKLVQEIRSALALLRNAIQPGAMADADYPVEENEFFTDGAGI
jgi:hypothetical protein